MWDEVQAIEAQSDTKNLTSTVREIAFVCFMVHNRGLLDSNSSTAVSASGEDSNEQGGDAWLTVAENFTFTFTSI